MKAGATQQELIEEIRRLETKVSSLEITLQEERKKHEEHVRELHRRAVHRDLYIQDSSA